MENISFSVKRGMCSKFFSLAFGLNTLRFYFIILWNHFYNQSQLFISKCIGMWVHGFPSTAQLLADSHWWSRLSRLPAYTIQPQADPWTKPGRSWGSCSPPKPEESGLERSEGKCPRIRPPFLLTPGGCGGKRNNQRWALKERTKGGDEI